MYTPRTAPHIELTMERRLVPATYEAVKKHLDQLGDDVSAFAVDHTNDTNPAFPELKRFLGSIPNEDRKRMCEELFLKDLLERGSTDGCGNWSIETPHGSIEYRR